jgi:hypothetical protein
MTSEDFAKSLRAFRKRTPFRPFAVEIVSGSRIVVDHPEALVFRGSTAVYVAPDGTPTIFDHEGVSRIDGDAEKASAGAAKGIE